MNWALIEFIFLAVIVSFAWAGKYRLSIWLFILFLLIDLWMLSHHFSTHYPLEF